MPGSTRPGAEQRRKEWGFEVCQLRARGKPPRQWVEQTVYNSSLKPLYGLSENTSQLHRRHRGLNCVATKTVMAQVLTVSHYLVARNWSAINGFVRPRGKATRDCSAVVCDDHDGRQRRFGRRRA